MEKLRIFVAAIACAVAVVAVSLLIATIAHRTSVKAATVDLPAGFIAATPEFLADADAYTQLTTDAARRLKAFTTSAEFKEIQSEQDRAKGIDTRATVPCSATSGPVCTPAGFRYDNQRRAFAPIAPQISGPSVSTKDYKGGASTEGPQPGVTTAK